MKYRRTPAKLARKGGEICGNRVQETMRTNCTCILVHGPAGSITSPLALGSAGNAQVNVMSDPPHLGTTWGFGQT